MLLPVEGRRLREASGKLLVPRLMELAGCLRIQIGRGVLTLSPHSGHRRHMDVFWFSARSLQISRGALAVAVEPTQSVAATHRSSPNGFPSRQSNTARQKVAMAR